MKLIPKCVSDGYPLNGGVIRITIRTQDSDYDKDPGFGLR